METVAALVASPSLDFAALDAALPVHEDDPDDAHIPPSAGAPDPSSSSVALLARMPRLLAADLMLAKQLDAWAEGFKDLQPGAVDLHLKQMASLLQLMPRLIEVTSSDGVLLATSSTEHADANTEADEKKSYPRSNEPATKWSRFEEEEAAIGQWLVVRAQCPLGARLLAALSEAAAEVGAHDAGATDPLCTPELARLASAATEALARAVGSPQLPRLRAASMGNVCRFLNAELRRANALKIHHRTRRLTAALCHYITSVRLPHLGRATDAHKLLPLLLRWSRELLDPHARAPILRAVHHAIGHLPAAEVRWHGAYLSAELRGMIVFREVEALRYLVPALWRAWPHITSEHAMPDPSARERHHLELIELIVNEILYVAPYATPRRLYLATLPRLLPHLGLRLALKMRHILGGVVILLDAESEALTKAHGTWLKAHDEPARAASRRAEAALLDAAAADSASDAQAAESVAAAAEGAPPPVGSVLASRGVCDALTLLACVLREVWPRAAAHAATIAKHAIGVYIKAAVATHASVLPGAMADAAAVLEAARALLRLLCDAGGEEACSTALAAARTRTAAYGGAMHTAAVTLEEAVCGEQRHEGSPPSPPP